MIGFTNETLANLPSIAAGDEVRCRYCRETHAVMDSEPPGLLFVSCPGVLGSVEPRTYLVGVGGKNVIGVQPDLSDDRPAQPICDECWENEAGDKPPDRIADADAVPCAICGQVSASGIYVLAPLVESIRARDDA